MASDIKAKRARRKKGDPPRSHFEKVRDELHWSSQDVAEQIGATRALVDRWALTDNVPAEIMVWMEGLLAFRQKFPPPTGWKRRPGKRGSSKFSVARRFGSAKLPT